MEKLKLEHIAPYLPYGARVQLAEDKGTEYNDKEYILTELNIDTHLCKIKSNGYVFTESIYSIKPLLRPLSDLYKEITHNGKTFIPYKDLDWENYNDEMGYIVSAEYGENPRIAINVLDFIGDYYKLLEWNFDVFSLIDKGLAIDLNTVKP